ncbi:hypothetical protein B9X71_08970 [Acinetobacter baumannii]|uniref:hypothetical protein n=1 Tax=Acinetobacter baumannii TaxID=470 RepID=UPI000A32F95F|nr:hypothetical protein [Acinetobacter baumannii]OTK46957.1 hypothetical protein B9X71_08970 [Acinetobacter baumannii]
MDLKNIKEVINTESYITRPIPTVKTLKEQNIEIKSRLISEIETLVKKIESYLDQTAFSTDLLSKHFQFYTSNEPHLKKLIKTARVLEGKINFVDVEAANLTYMDSISFSLNYINKDYDENNIHEFTFDIFNSLSTLNAINDYIDNYARDSEIYNQIITSKITAMLNEATEELEDLKKTKNILKNYKAEQFYNSECEKYTALHVRYKNYFVFLIIMAVLLSIASVELVVLYKMDEYIYWSIKITIILAFITLITYYLKQSSYYQRLAEQANQTRLEIEAFPSFIAGVSKAEEVAIRKELALKYFGKEIDGAAHKDMSNLIADQMKNTTEMVKATTEAIKNLKG